MKEIRIEIRGSAFGKSWPWGLLAACALGGSVIEIPMWAMILLGLAGVVVFLVVLKYGDRWEDAILRRFQK